MKRVILMVGIPGSGKTTLVNEVFPGARVCSADEYFVDAAGVYKFDATKLAQAHAYCHNKFRASLEAGYRTIVIDNTNIDARHRLEYAGPAERAGYQVVEIRLYADANEAHARCAHNVPLATIERMSRRLDI